MQFIVIALLVLSTVLVIQATQSKRNLSYVIAVAEMYFAYGIVFGWVSDVSMHINNDIRRIEKIKDNQILTQEIIPFDEKKSGYGKYHTGYRLKLPSGNTTFVSRRTIRPDGNQIINFGIISGIIGFVVGTTSSLTSKKTSQIACPRTQLDTESPE